MTKKGAPMAIKIIKNRVNNHEQGRVSERSLAAETFLGIGIYVSIVCNALCTRDPVATHFALLGRDATRPMFAQQ